MRHVSTSEIVLRASCSVPALGYRIFGRRQTVFVNGFGKVRAFSIATGLNPRNVTANWTWSYGSPSPMVTRESSSRLASARREPTIRTR